MLPYKIVQDLNPAAAPENSSTLNVNVNFDILKQALINEQGFDKLSTTGKEIIGSTILPNNSICVFSVINISNTLYSEIGIITDTTYKIVLRDTTLASLGFTTEHQIQAQSKVNFNGDYIVYWVDGFNPDRWLNVTFPQVDITFTAITNIPEIANAAQLGLMLGFTPTRGEYIDQTATAITGGSLTAAVYYIVCTYGDKYKNFTQTLYVSSPIPVTASSLPFNNEFIGSAAGTVTDKAITISIAAARLNPEYDFIRVQVIRKQNQVLSGWNFGEFPFNASTAFTCLIDSLTDEVAVDSILINLANYKSSLTITQLDDVLYKAHLRAKAEFDFQPYVNNTKINYKQKQITLDLSIAGENYKDPNMCFYSKGFMYDEIYAFYQSFIIEEEGQEYETKAYHIPGRQEATISLGTVNPLTWPLEGDLISSLTGANYTSTYYVDGTINDCTPLSQLSRVSPQAKVMHAVATADNPNAVALYGSNMGYWENDNENYADRNSWLVLDTNGNTTGNYKTQKVRHHRFPEPFVASGYLDKDSIHPSSTNYSQVNILGVELSNIVIPAAYAGKVKAIKLYYAKREFNDRTILGQSLMTSLCQFHTYNGDFDVDKQIISGLGNFLHYEMSSNNSTLHSTGMFPLGYELTTGQDASLWTWNNHAKTIRPDDEVSGFFKLKPFDMMQQSLTTLTTSYIKNLYRVPSRYFEQGLTGDVALYNNTTSVKYKFQPDIDFYGGINRTVRAGVSPLANQYRKIVNVEYVDQNVPTVPGNAGVTPYGFSMNPYNYAGDKAIWAQTEKKLFYAVDALNLGSGVNADTAAVSFISIAALMADNAAGFRASPYISNMCAFKVSLFTTFDNQILCEAGVVDVDAVSKQFYGGDTFTSYYGERSTFDTTAYSPTSPTDYHGFINTIHYYVSQSTGNINYRYKGNNTWETFYPKETWEFMRNLPFINPEWYGYNNDYSANNDLLQPVIASNAESQFQDYFPNRVIRSATDNPEIMSDNYLIYEAGNYRDVGKAKGPIENIANQNSKLLIKARKALFYTLGREIINTENSESYVGAGDIFAVKPKESVSSDSYGGGIGRFSDVITQYGYMYADATNGIVYVAAPASTSKGDSINEISNEGLQIFFRTELKFKLPEQLYDKYYSLLDPFIAATASYLKDWYVTFNGEIWKSNIAIISPSTNYPGQSSAWDKVDFYTLTDNTTDIQGIGIHATFDYKYRRYILAKKDYNFVEFLTEWLPNIPDEPADENYGKIVYYNGVIYQLGASGTELPRGYHGVKIDFAAYFEDKSFTIAFYPESKAWVSMYDYYPNFLFNTIDKVYSTKNTGVFKHNSNTQNNFYYDNNIVESFVEPILNAPAGVKKFASISFFTDVFVKTITTKALQYLDTFTTYFVRNTWQMSRETAINNGTTSRNAERVFNTNDFRDFTRDNNDALMDTKYIPQQNLSNLNVFKHWSLQKKFVDYFLIPRFKFKQEWETINLEVASSIVFSSSTVLFSPTFTFNIGDTIRFIYPDTFTYIFTITKILTGNILYEFETRGVNNAFAEMTISTFDYLPNKEIHIYDISSQSTKNIR